MINHKVHEELLKRTRLLKAELDHFWYDAIVQMFSEGICTWEPFQYSKQWHAIEIRPVRSITTIGLDNKPFSFWFPARDKNRYSNYVWKILNQYTVSI
jgi:hypothetical protein